MAYTSAGVMKLANMHDSNSCGETLVGSIPTSGTLKVRQFRSLTFIFPLTHGIIELISSVLKTMVYYDPNL